MQGECDPNRGSDVGKMFIVKWELSPTRNPRASAPNCPEAYRDPRGILPLRVRSLSIVTAVKWKEIHTVDVILRVRFGRLIVVDHLHHLQQVVFSELLKVFGELVHVDL